MKRVLCFLLSLVMVVSIFVNVPATVITASAIEEGLSSVATVEPTAYGVLDTEVKATKVTLGKGYYLNSNVVDYNTQWDNYGEGYILVEDEAGTTFYLVGTEGVVKSFYSDSGEKPRFTLINEYSIDNPHALYRVYNPKTEKYDFYNANTCQYYEYGADEVTPYSWSYSSEYAKNTIKVKIDGKYGLINNKGQMIYSPVYEDIFDYENCFVGAFEDANGYRRYALLSNNGSTSGTKLYDEYLIYDDILFAVSDIEVGEIFETADYMDWALINNDLSLMTDFIYSDVEIAESNGTYYRVCSRAFEETDAYGDTEIYYLHQIISDKGNSWDVCQKFNCISSAVGIYNSHVDICENGLKIYITDDYGYYYRNGTGVVNPDLKIPEFNNRYILAKPNGEEIFNIAVDDGNLNTVKNRWQSVQAVYGKCEYRKEYKNSKYVHNLYDSRENLISDISLSDVNVMGDYLVYKSSSNPEESFIYNYVNEEMAYDKIYIDTVEVKGNGVCFAQNKDSNQWAIFDTATGTCTDCLITIPDIYVTQNGFITNGKRKLWVCYGDDKYIYVNDKGIVLSTSSDEDSVGCLLKSGDYLIKSISEERGYYDYTYEVEIIDYDGKVIENFNRKIYGDYTEADVYISTDSNDYRRGLISQNGATVIDNVAEEIGTCYNGLTYIVDDDYGAVVDNSGKALMYGEFDIDDYSHSFESVGVSGFASFVKDNEVYIYDFTACHGFDRKTDSSFLTEDDLFGEYSAFLNNGFYNSLYKTAGEQVANSLSHYGENARAIAFAKSALDGQTGYLIEKLVDCIPGSSLNETKAKQEMALEYLNSLDTETTGKYLKNISTIRGITSKINNATKLDYDLKSEKSKVQFVEIWTDGTGFSSSEVYKVIDEAKKHQNRFDAYFKATGRTIKILEYVNSYLTIYLLQRDLVKSLMDLIPKNSDLYEGLKYISTKQSKSGTVVTIVKEMLTDEILNIVGDFADDGFMKLAGVKNANVATLVLYVGGKIAAKAIDSPKLEDIDKAVLAYANMITLKTAVNNYHQTIADNYSNGGSVSVEVLKSEYALLCDTFYKSIFTALKYANEIASDGEKNIITKYIAEFEKKLIYRSYIKTCLLNARTQWEYTVEANKAVITKLKAEYPSGEGRVPYMELYNSYFDVNEEMNKTAYAFEYAIDIPSTIDGYQVSSIGTNSFSDDNRVTGVYIPDTVNEIQNSAFENCGQINSVYIGSSVETIGDSAFENCDDLSFINIPDSVNSIGENSFGNIDDLLVTGSDCDMLDNITSESITTQVRDLSAINLEIITQATKTEFNMQEEIDTTGLVIRVTYSDGSTKDITDGFYADVYNRVVGENTVMVAYEGLVVEYSVNILASQCNYTVSYQDEHGNVIADGFTGSAVAGSTLTLEIPEIVGYMPVNKTQTEIIGYNNNFIVVYTEIPKLSIENAIVTVGNQFFAYENLTPDVTVELDGEILIQGQDFTVTYADNYSVGTAVVIIIGIGDYEGVTTANFRIVEKAHDWSNWYIDYDATVNRSGSKYRVCEICEKYEYATIPQLKPAKPKLSKIENTADGVKITWGKVSGADKYDVYRKIGSGKYSKIGTTSKTYYTDKKASSGKKYYYYVKAVNEAGSSDASSSKSIYYLADTTLSTPKSTKSGITLKWKKITGSEGYYVYRKIGSGSYSKIATVKGSTKVTYTDKKAKKGKTYTYKIKAYKSKTYSAYSNAKKIKDKY